MYRLCTNNQANNSGHFCARERGHGRFLNPETPRNPGRCDGELETQLGPSLIQVQVLVLTGKKGADEEVDQRHLWPCRRLSAVLRVPDAIYLQSRAGTRHLGKQS
jgi:hypothetical protein